MFGLGWLFPTRVAAAKAWQLQDMVRASERDASPEVDERSVGVATIHSREDMVTLCSWQSAHHRQLVTISRGVWALVFLLWFTSAGLADHFGF
jgi:hypothetical protein